MSDPNTRTVSLSYGYTAYIDRDANVITLMHHDCVGHAYSETPVLQRTPAVEVREHPEDSNLLIHSRWDRFIGFMLFNPTPDYSFPADVPSRFVEAYHEIFNPKAITMELNAPRILTYTVSVISFYQNPMIREGVNIATVITTSDPKAKMPVVCQGLPIEHFPEDVRPLLSGCIRSFMHAFRSRKARTAEEIRKFNISERSFGPVGYIGVEPVGEVNARPDTESVLEASWVCYQDLIAAARR